MIETSKTVHLMIIKGGIEDLCQRKLEEQALVDIKNEGRLTVDESDGENYVRIATSVLRPVSRKGSRSR